MNKQAKVLTLIFGLVGNLICHADTYTVTTTNDSGPNSLRAVITIANGISGPHTINLGNTGHFAGGGTIALVSALPVITQSMRIAGWRNGGATDNAISITGSSFIFGAGTSNSLQQVNIGGSITSGQNISINGCVITGTVTSGESIAITGCVIANGGIQSTGNLQMISSSVVASPAAGIWSSGNATLNGVTISQCNGGGIHNEGTMVIADSLISSNSSPTDGGGIFSAKALQVTGCQIIGNRAISGGGGGVFNAGIASILRTSIRGNTAYVGIGGGIYTRGSITLVESLVTQNLAQGQSSNNGGGGGAGFGGGVYCSSNLMATNTTFSGNIAAGGSSAAGWSGSGGGPYGGLAGISGTSARCNVPAGNGTAGSPGGWMSGGGAGGAGGGGYGGDPGGQNCSGCSVGSCGHYPDGLYWYHCGQHVLYYIGSSIHPCGQQVPSVTRCPYYRACPPCAAQAAGLNGPGSSGGYGGGGGSPGGIGGTFAGGASGGSGGGGAALGSAIFLTNGFVFLVNCTVSSNQATVGLPGGHGVAAVFNYFGQVSTLNTIIGGNSTGSSDGPDVYGSFSSKGYNFIGNNAGSTGWDPVWDYQNAVPLLLGPLQDNGGPTFTHSLLPGSLCILSGKSVGAPQNDQRGVIRPLNKCDIGAYQFTTLLVPAITWTNPAPIVYGTALSSAQLNASADIGGSFAYTPAAGAVLPAGSNQVLTAIFTPADPTTATGATNTVMLTVFKANQTIAFDPIPAQTVNAPPILLTATASSGLPATFSLVSGPALLAGNLLSVGGTPGLVTVRASQSGSPNFNAAPDVDQSFLVLTNAKPIITADPTNVTVDLGSDASFSVSATTAPLNYQWRFNGLDLPGATSSTLLLPRTTTNQAGPYRVVVSNPLGAVTSVVAVLNVLAPPGVPQIVSQPHGQVGRAGETAALSVGATGNPTLLYQWYQGASPNTNGLVSGAIAANYTTPPLSTNTSYWVSVRNSLGMVDSVAAAVTVVPAAAPRLSLARFSGMAAIYLDGPLGTQYLLQYSTNPMATNWNTLLDYTQNQNPFIYIDAGSLGIPYRFYRAMAH